MQREDDGQRSGSSGMKDLVKDEVYEMNTLKTMILMALLAGLMVAVGGAAGGPRWATVMLVVSLAIDGFAYWFSAPLVLRAYKAQDVTPAEAPELCAIVRALAERAGLPMPRVAIIESDVPNAFATGRDPEHAVVAVTTALMETLDRDELAGVLAHELTHVKSRDILTSSIAAAMASVISWAAQMAFFFGGRDDDDDSTSLAVAFVAPVAATLIQLAVSRSREYAADEGSGELTGNPLALARALAKLEDSARHTRPPEDATPATAHMFIVNPFAGMKSKIARLYATHPSTEERIRRLEEQAKAM